MFTYMQPACLKCLLVFTDMPSTLVMYINITVQKINFNFTLFAFKTSGILDFMIEF